MQVQVHDRAFSTGRFIPEGTEFRKFLPVTMFHIMLYSSMANPSPHHRHQASLKGVIDFSTEPPLGANERVEARRRFYHIVNHFEDTEKRNSSGSSGNEPYNRPVFVRLTYEYALSEESQDHYLRAFFRFMALSVTGEDVDFGDKNLKDEIRSTLLSFADYLLDSFFLPLRASTKKTPQPSPAHRSAVERGAQQFFGTPERVSALHGTCLVRDRHRCVISRRFDQKEAVKRWEKDGKNYKDDDGNSLVSEGFNKLEVAHILPRSLTKIESGSELSASKQAALAILNMFDSGIGHLIEGANIDQPHNALTLTADLHELFGDFRIYFTSTEQEHSYRIDSFLPPALLPIHLPVTRTLYLTPNRTIDPPLPRLLAIHRAIAHILHLSAAGQYIDRILRDVEETGVRADGSTDLSRILRLGLGGWLRVAI
ncbi:hypothetical protein BDY21DRAFT_312010 [Lineolata rhizophorae]|uniref:HNH nuclease domain-containing protein n=1 Tax=Lineolata rhizophorae TaxID=578093 RepID=A0A6A6NLG9_9PEZI|nr:hypothetical protein BDY21DRAFT_312010 [Lineolata rhizophorae]